MPRDSSHERYRENWDKAFGSFDQGHSPIDTASSSNDKTSDDSNGAFPLTVLEVQSKQEGYPTTTPKKKCRRPNPWLEFTVQALLCLFTLGAFIAAAIYAHIARLQRDSMDNTFHQIEQQTTLMRQQLVGTQAAVLEFGMTLNDVGEFVSGLSNVGHVSATNIEWKVEATRGTLPAGTSIGVPLVFSETFPGISPNRPVTRTRLLPWRPTELSNPTGWSPEWPGKHTYILRAEVSYGNGFGDRVTHHACQVWLPRFMIVYKQQASGGGGLMPCDDLQTAIKSVLEQEKRASAGADRPN